MAQKKVKPGPAASKPPVAPRPRWLAFALVAALALGGGIALTWHHRAASSMERRLPVPPDLTGKPAELRDRLADARRRIAADSDAPSALAELGRLYHANGFVTAAETCWRLLHETQPMEAHWPYYLADLSRTTSDETGLQAWLAKTVELTPYAPAWLQLGDLAFKRGQLDAAEQAYRRRSEVLPGDPYASFGLARVALQRGQRAEARRAIEELIRVSPDFPSAQNFYAELLAQERDLEGAARQRWLGTVTGRFRAAGDPWLEELRASCYDTGQLIIWGTIDLQTGHGDRGRTLFERAVRLAPDKALAYEKLGEFYLEQGELEQARVTLERGRQVPDATESLYSLLFRTYRAHQRPADALRVAEQGLLLAPDSANLHNARGLALADTGRIEEALEAHRTAMARAPGAPDAVTNFAVTLLQAGRRDEALAQLNRALELQPQYSRAIMVLAELELEAGRTKEAAQYILPFFRQFPGSRNARDLVTQLHVTRALAAARGGDPAAVERICREGLALVPDAPELHGLLGSHYLQANRLKEALEAFEAAQRLNPTDLRTLLPLAQLYVTFGRPAEARQRLTEGEALARRRGDTEAASRFAELLRRLPQ